MIIVDKYRIVITLISLSVFPSNHLVAQPSTGSVVGHVICSDGNVPARGAHVELIPLETLLPKAAALTTPNAKTTTDFTGSYEISSINPGIYLVNATLGGYSDDLKLVRTVLDHYSLDEQKSLLATFPQVTVKAGSSARQDVVLRRAAAISGRLSVDLGGAMEYTLVTATLISGKLIGNAETTNSKSILFSQSGMTDDLGNYRIAGLPPGSYRLSARFTEGFLDEKQNPDGQIVAESKRAGIATLIVFAEDALDDSEAKLVKVDNGDEITDMNITIPSRLLHSLGGAVTQGGVPAKGVAVEVQRQGRRIMNSDAITTSDGIYRFDLLPPGDYTIIVAKYPSPSPQNGAESVASKAEVVSKLGISLMDSDVLDANIDLRTQTNQKQ